MTKPRPPKTWTRAADRPPHCIVEGCAKPLHQGCRSQYGFFCTMHYRRVEKHGEPGGVESRVGRGPWQEQRGFFLTYKPQHPVATASGDVRLHRVIARNNWGADEQPCGDCGRLLAWGPGLLVRAVDGNLANVAPDNLVASCRSCHARRNLHMGPAA